VSFVKIGPKGRPTFLLGLNEIAENFTRVPLQIKQHVGIFCRLAEFTMCRLNIVLRRQRLCG